MPEESIAHAPVRQVPIMGGTHLVTVRPWTIAQRQELRPLVGAVIQRFAAVDGSPHLPPLDKLFLEAETEVLAVVQASVSLPAGVSWDAVWWEDVPSLAQAIWETSIVRPGGGGLAGKLSGVLARAFLGAVARLEQKRATAATPGQAAPATPSPAAETSRSPDSPSSPGDGAATPSGSAAL